MKTRRAFCTILLLAAASSGCDWHRIRGNGIIKTEQRPVNAFAQIDASGVYEVEWSQGAPSLSVTTDENLFSYVKTRISGDRLKIEMRREAILPTETIKIVVTSPSLNGVQLNGAVHFNGRQLSGQTFAIETSGAAKVTLAGAVHHLLADLTGASQLQAADLSAADVELSVTGAGKADVTATNSLQASITGAGKVTYGGNPKTVQRQIAGAGKIIPR
jgi:hypothetical protein